MTMSYPRNRLVAIAGGFIVSALAAGASLIPGGNALGVAGNQHDEFKGTQSPAAHFKQLTFRLDTSGSKSIVLPKTDAPVRVEISITNIVCGPDPKLNAKEEAARPILLTGTIVRDSTSGLLRFRVGSLNPCSKPEPSSREDAGGEHTGHAEPGHSGHAIVNLDCDFAAVRPRMDDGLPVGSLEAQLQLDTKTGDVALVTKFRGVVNSPNCCINLWF
jgi:hypothetical protein